jgi:GDP-mannose 6-dehydrogenase
LIGSVLRSNEQQIAAAFNIIHKQESKTVGVFGLSFKPGTDDLRESPMVTLVERLIGKGYHVKIHDQNVSLARLMGSNKEYIERIMPHISNLMEDDVEAVLAHGSTLVFGHKNVAYQKLREKIQPHQFIVDLVRLWEDYRELGRRYQGICWG